MRELSDNSIIAVAPDGVVKTVNDDCDFTEIIRDGRSKCSSELINFFKQRREKLDGKKIKIQKKVKELNVLSILEKMKMRKTRWGPPDEKRFTPQPFSQLPSLPPKDIEILISTLNSCLNI
jgi:hypothetical protein